MAQLRRQLAQLLFLSQHEIGDHDTFVDLGLDSIIGIEWTKQIHGELKLELAATRLYDYPTLSALAGFLSSQLSAEAPIESRSELAATPAAPVTPAAPLTIATPPETAPAPTPESNAGATDPIASDIREIAALLVAQLADVLFLSPGEIREDDRFVELGLDSIIGIEWIKSINQRFGLTLAATRLYDYPTVADLARFIATLTAPASTPVPESRQPVAVAAKTAPPQPTPPSATDLAPIAGLTATARPEPRPASPDAERIAIVGMSGRFPGARNLEQLWQNLATGTHSVAEIPGERWRAESYFDPASRGDGAVYAKWLGALDGADEFDPLFFNLAPSEAEFMDPQQRLFLQEAWRAFEDAGYSRAALDGSRCGTYVGIMLNDYWHVLSRRRQRLGTAPTMLGNSNAISAARIAYLLNLKGPALAIDTACSSSLVATHQACRALAAGDIDIALVGGVTLYLVPEVYMQMCEAGM
ncbi:MAG: beta-ketoacyl synthase N-terminal-like domain-containing protein, partial [Myxococcota bacterium]